MAMSDSRTMFIPQSPQLEPFQLTSVKKTNLVKHEYDDSMRNDSHAIYRYIMGQQPFDMLGHYNYHPTSAASMPVGREEVVSHHANSHEEVEVEVDVCTDFYATQSPHQVEEVGPKKPPAKKKNSRQYRCKVCFKTFNQLVNLVTHERIHTGERPFRCEICLKTFTQQPNLWKHIRTHTGERPYRCETCNKGFTQQANLVKHIRIHTGEKPYVCRICNKAFTQQANLNKHIRLHTGERPFHCRLCTKTFTQQSNLERHERTHSGAKPFSCKVCWKSFAQNVNLLKHEATHGHMKQLLNGELNKDHSNEQFLLVQQDHSASNTIPAMQVQVSLTEPKAQEEFPSASFSSKTFTQQSNLERHERAHSGAKPFSCKVCWKSFAQNVNLLKHEATHGHMKQQLNGELNKDHSNEQFLLVQQDHSGSNAIPAMQVQVNLTEPKATEEFPSASFSCEQNCPKDHEQHEQKCGIPVILCTKTGKILRRVETP